MSIVDRWNGWKGIISENDEQNDQIEGSYCWKFWYEFSLPSLSLSFPLIFTSSPITISLPPSHIAQPFSFSSHLLHSPSTISLSLPPSHTAQPFSFSSHFHLIPLHYFLFSLPSPSLAQPFSFLSHLHLILPHYFLYFSLTHPPSTPFLCSYQPIQPIEWEKQKRSGHEWKGHRLFGDVDMNEMLSELITNNEECMIEWK